MDNIREIFLLFEKSVQVEAKIVRQNQEIRTFVKLGYDSYISIESLILLLDRPIPLSWTHEVNWNLININNNFSTLRKALESWNIENLWKLYYVGNWYFYINEWRLILAEDLMIIKDLNEYKKQKEEETGKYNWTYWGAKTVAWWRDKAYRDW